MATDLAIGVGFGTAALGDNTFSVVQTALEVGFRKFDTAEADWWYNQKQVATSLKSFFQPEASKCKSCIEENLQISTKIPPWELTSITHIRSQAANSRAELVGFCEDVGGKPYPLDVYYIHAPRCWEGWHARCEGVGETLPLRETWMAMEAVVRIDYSSRRIGLSNVWPEELLDIIQFVKERQKDAETHPEKYYTPPRMPDVVQAYADPIHPSHELRKICREHGIEFVSYSTLGTQHRNQENPVLNSETILQLSEKHQRSTAEVVLSWAIQNGMSVIPRSTKRDHIMELANMLKYPPFLEDGDLSLVDGMALN